MHVRAITPSMPCAEVRPASGWAARIRSVVLAGLCAACGAGGSAAAAASPETPAPGRPAGAGSEIRFRLAADARTSAGVFAPDGTLLRTLWRGEPRKAGAQTAVWDLRDDGGRRVTQPSVEVRVIAHGVRHEWDGVLGNTSAFAPWGQIHRSFGVPVGLLATPAGMLIAMGYNEGQNGVGGFAWGQVQRSRSPIRHVDAFSSVAMLAADDARVYWVNGGGVSKASFVGVFEAARGGAAEFSEGAALCLNRMADGRNCYPDQTYRSVIAARQTEAERPTGLAVQRSGRVLAVARGSEGRVELYDKRSGRPIGGLALSLRAGASNQLAMTPSGELWVLGPTEATRFASLGGTPVAVARIGGLERPLAVAADPAEDGAVWIAEGGSRQQLRRFDRDGQPGATLGRTGGMRGRPEVGDDRLCFQAGPDREQTAIAVAPDGAVWVVDTCNVRLAAFGRQGRIETQVAWLPASYVATVDPGDPARVFANFLEYRVDPGLALHQPGAWQLLRNWLPALTAELRDASASNGGLGGFRLVRTLSNGRSYAVMQVGGRQELAELTPEGEVRRIGPLRSASAGGTPPFLEAGGDLVDAVLESGFQSVRRQQLTGFDVAGNPRWARETELLARAPALPNTPYFRPGSFSGAAPPRFPVTPSGRVLFFDPLATGNEGFHLGAVALGGDRWLWQASPSGALDGRGSFQTRQLDGSTQYAGNALMHADGAVVFGYHGEFHRDLGNGRVGQANQFMHFREDGLFVGQFGVASTRSREAVEPGRSGNAFSPTLVRHEGRLLLYHNDESTFGGVHRWRFEGLDTFTEQRAVGAPGETFTLR